MNIKDASYAVLEQLESVLKQIKQDDYVKIIPSHDASVGQHVRHMIEFFLCLLKGIDTGIVNYDKRKRDHRIESEPETAITLTREIMGSIRQTDENPAMVLEINYDISSDINHNINTSFIRELAYNIEHAIHHMAIIKSILTEFFGYISLPVNFGVAASTVRFRNRALN